MPSHTTKRRTTINLETKNNKNCQKIELYGSPTTKELKKKHSSRLGWRQAARVERAGGKAAVGGLGHVRQKLVEWAVPHLCVDKPGGTTGE